MGSFKFAIAALLSAACVVNAADITVNVAQGGALNYTSNNFNASVGDTVTFHFAAGPHTVTQSSYSSPCVKLSGGFDSSQQSANSVFTYNVKSTDPVYFHCAVGNHCSRGMVGAINAGNTFEAFQTSATSGKPPPSTSAGSSASGAPASTASTSAASETTPASSAARQISGGSVLSAAMALLVGLAL